MVVIKGKMIQIWRVRSADMSSERHLKKEVEERSCAVGRWAGKYIKKRTWHDYVVIWFMNGWFGGG